MEKIRVGVLFGGVSGEHQVSLMSARSILKALSPEKYEVTQIGISPDGSWFCGEDVLGAFENEDMALLTRVFMFPHADGGRLYHLAGSKFESFQTLDILFPILHGTFGEDGNLQGYLEIADVAYVGADVASSAVCMEKGLFKDLMLSHGLPVAVTMVFTRKQVQDQIGAIVERVESKLEFPVFVKPVNLGSSVGVHKCHDRLELKKGLVDAVRYSREVAVEQGIDAREIEVSVLGDENSFDTSIPGEIRYRDEFYSYEAKYFDDMTELVIPAPLPDDLALQIRQMAGKVFQIVGCSGMARVDFLLDKKTHQIYISELNTIPGFTHASMYPRLWEYSGMTYGELVDRLIEIGLKRFEEKKKTVFQYNARRNS